MVANFFKQSFLPFSLFFLYTAVHFAVVTERWYKIRISINEKYPFSFLDIRISFLSHPFFYWQVKVWHSVDTILNSQIIRVRVLIVYASYFNCSQHLLNCLDFSFCSLYLLLSFRLKHSQITYFSNVNAVNMLTYTVTTIVNNVLSSGFLSSG